MFYLQHGLIYHCFFFFFIIVWRSSGDADAICGSDFILFLSTFGEGFVFLANSLYSNQIVVL